MLPAAGDLVEVVLRVSTDVKKTTSYAPAAVLAVARAKCNLRYDNLARPADSTPNDGPRHVTTKPELLADIARIYGLHVHDLTDLNATLLPNLSRSTVLEPGTAVRLPDVYGTRNDDSARTVARLHGISVQSLIDANVRSYPDLVPSSRFVPGTQLIVPPPGADEASEAAPKPAQPSCGGAKRKIEMHWDDLSAEDQQAAAGLGFRKNSWNHDDWSAITTRWEDLSAEHRLWVQQLDFDHALWRGGRGEPLPMPPRRQGLTPLSARAGGVLKRSSSAGESSPSPPPQPSGSARAPPQESQPPKGRSALLCKSSRKATGPSAAGTVRPPRLGTIVEIFYDGDDSGSGDAHNPRASRTGDIPEGYASVVSGKRCWWSALVMRAQGGSKFVCRVRENWHCERNAELEGSQWRYPPGATRPGDDGPSVATLVTRGLLPDLGAAVDVEVEEAGVHRWRRAEVRWHLVDGRFAVCVDGDEDFIEAYAIDEEGAEWRHPPDPPLPRLEKWVPADLVRPRPPASPPDFLRRCEGGTVQVLQDGSWCRATLIGTHRLLNGEALPSAPPTLPIRGLPPRMHLVTARLLGSDNPPLLRISADYVRPDWDWHDGEWRVLPLRKRKEPGDRRSASAGRAQRAGGAASDEEAADEAATSQQHHSGRQSALRPRSTSSQPLASHGWARPGARAETKISHKDMRAAWWAVELLELQPGSALVAVSAFAEEDNSSERHQEWVPWERIRPCPPVTPADWLEATRLNEAVQFWWEDAWWDAKLMSTGRIGADLLVQRLGCSHTQTVPARFLRPGWRWLEPSSCDAAAADELGWWWAPCIEPSKNYGASADE